ncbi:Protein of unknown function [Gryllus bimaculatus]|nr:Protein of unknown function [Gryllus bimaculatus]
MLGRWRTQNAKLLEEERLNEERERSPSDVASPSSDAASPRSPDASVPTTPTTPTSAITDTPTVELASTPAAPANTPATEPQLTPASAASDQPLAEPASAPATPTSAQPTPLALNASTRVQQGTPGEAEDSYNTPAAQSEHYHDHAPDPAGGVDAPPADAPAPEDGIRDTPSSATGHAKDLEESKGAPVAVEATSSEHSDTLKTEDDLTITNNSQACQKDAEMVLKVGDSSKETVGEINSGDAERSKIEGSADTQNQQKSVDTLKNSTGTPIEVVKTASGLDAQIEQKQTMLDCNGSALSKNSVKDEQQSSLAERNESLAPNKGNGWQTCAPTHPGSVHCQFGRYMPIQYYAPPPQRPLNGAPPCQTTGAPSRSQSPFETVNYLSQSTLGHCAQRTYGAAKANRVTGCALRVVEKGVRLVTAPVVSIFGLWPAPLLCVDRTISRGAREVARVFACAPRAEEAGESPTGESPTAHNGDGPNEIVALATAASVRLGEAVLQRRATDR